MFEEVVLKAVEIKRGPKMNNAERQLTRSLLGLAYCHHVLGYHKSTDPFDLATAASPGAAQARMRYRLDGAIHLLVAPASGVKTPLSRTFDLPWASPGGPIAHPGCTCELNFQVTVSSQSSSLARDENDGDYASDGDDGEMLFEAA